MSLRRWGEPAAALGLAAALAALARLHAPGLIGYVRDDGQYAAAAHALLAGLGYVDPATTGAPPFSRYPAGYPLILAMSMIGADGPERLARLAWAGPLALAAYALVCWLVLRRVGGFPPWAAALGAAGCAGNHLVLGLGTTLWSDLPFAVLVLGAVLLGDRLLKADTHKPTAWGALGLLLAAACLVRYAGAAVVLAFGAVLLARRLLKPTLALAVGFGAGFGPWLAYRARLGGEQYGANATAFLPETPAAWPGRLGEALGTFVAGGPSASFLPQAIDAGLGPAGILGAVVTGVVGYGAWRWSREPGPLSLPLAVAATTAALAAGWLVLFVRLEPGLSARLLAPVAPLLWIAAVRGVRTLCMRSRVAPPWPALGGLVALALVADLALTPWPAQAQLAGQAQDHRGLLNRIAAEVPIDAVLLSAYNHQTWLYTGRAGYAAPPAIMAGRIAPLDPLSTLMVLEHWKVNWIAVQPNLPADVTNRAIAGFAQAYPGVLQTTWTGSGGGRLYRVRPAHFLALCKLLGIREKNAAFEAQEP